MVVALALEVLFVVVLVAASAFEVSTFFRGSASGAVLAIWQPG